MPKKPTKRGQASTPAPERITGTAETGSGGGVDATAAVNAIWDRYERIGRDYLADAQLSASTTATALQLIITRLDYDALPAEDRGAWEHLTRRTREVTTWAHAYTRWLHSDRSTPEPELPPPFVAELAVPDAELEAMREALRALPTETAALGYSDPERAFYDPEGVYREHKHYSGELERLLGSHSPAFARFVALTGELTAAATLTEEEVEARVTTLRTLPTGELAPHPREWATARGLSLETLQMAIAWVIAADKTSAAIATLLAEKEAELEKLRHEPRPARIGTAYLATINADKRKLTKARRKNPGAVQTLNDEKRRLFLADDYQPLTGYERVVLVALANLAWDDGLLDGVPAAATSRRVVDFDDLQRDTTAHYVRFRFPGYAEMARRVGAKPDADGRIPRNTTRALERALKQLSKEARWIPEPVRVREGKGRGKGHEWRDDVLVRQALWVELEALAESGEVLVKLHTAALTSMLASYVERDNLLEQYEVARKAIGARQLRDDFVACEDYLLHLRNANEGRRGRTEKPADGATEADRHVVVRAARALLWERMGWDKEAKKRGKRHAEKLEADALAFCTARGLLLEYREEASKKNGEPVLVFTLKGSRHPDPMQGTLFLPGDAA